MQGRVFRTEKEGIRLFHMNRWRNIMAPSRNRGRRRKTIPRQSSPSNRESIKEVRQEIRESHDHLVVCWHVGKIDWDGPWGMRACRNIDFRRLVDETISNWETMTWAELYRASGGRRRGTTIIRSSFRNFPRPQRKDSKTSKKTTLKPSFPCGSIPGKGCMESGPVKCCRCFGTIRGTTTATRRSARPEDEETSPGKFWVRHVTAAAK